MSDKRIEDETIAAVALAAGIEVPADDYPSLSAAFASQLEGIAALEKLDVSEVEPISMFDPRWT